LQVGAICLCYFLAGSSVIASLSISSWS
jgi:hypothetical protein